MINVFMVDNNESTIRDVKQYFSSLGSVCITKSCCDGKEALDDLLVNYQNYDVILLNPILASLDGIGILKKLRENNINTKVIIYADLIQEDLVKAIANYNISFYLLGKHYHFLI